MSKQNKQEKRADRRERFKLKCENALGEHWQTRLAAALDMPIQSINRMVNPPAGRDDAPNTVMMALAEFLSIVPKQYWPARFKDLD